MLTEAEQNRLILEFRSLVEPIAAEYRGRKNIPFEELVSEGVLGLVFAARNWQQKAKFSSYATGVIDGYLKNFVNSWEDFDQLDELTEDDENRIHEWQVWGILPSEGWNELPATPQEIREVFNAVKLRDPSAVEAAKLSMSRLERKMISAMFDSAPPMTVEQIARDCKRSYFETVTTLWSAVFKVAETFKRIADNRRAGFARPATHFYEVVPSR